MALRYMKPLKPMKSFQSTKSFQGFNSLNFSKKSFNFGFGTRYFSALVVAEHNNSSLSPSTLNTLTAAKQLSSEITVLLAGKFENDSIAQSVSKLDGVSKVLVANSDIYSKFLAEKYPFFFFFHFKLLFKTFKITKKV